MTTRLKAVSLAALWLPLCAVNLASQPVPARSETGKADWNNIKALAPGTKILVLPNRQGKTRGEVETVTEDSLVMRSRKGQETFARGDIVRVSVRESHRKRNIARGATRGAIIGAVVGAPLGALFCHIGTTPPSCPGQVVAVGALGAGVFGGYGALVGALVPAGEWREIYRQ
jgi:hypothetical protein